MLPLRHILDNSDLLRKSAELLMFWTEVYCAQCCLSGSAYLALPRLISSSENLNPCLRVTVGNVCVQVWN